MEKNGAELLRLWTAAADYQNDIVFSQTILNQLGESYRKIRNTCRYLLSNLYDFVPAATRWKISTCASWICWRWACCASATTRSSRPTGATPSTTVVRLLTDCGHHHVGGVPRPDQGRALLRGAGVAGAAQRADGALRDGADAGDLDGADPVLHRRRTSPTSSASATGVTFDVHGTVRGEQAIPGRAMKSNPNKRWLEEIRPRREAILGQLEAFRAAGHKSLEARVQVKPSRG